MTIRPFYKSTAHVKHIFIKGRHFITSSHFVFERHPYELYYYYSVVKPKTYTTMSYIILFFGVLNINFHIVYS